MESRTPTGQPSRSAPAFKVNGQGPVLVRHCRGLDELEACVELQKQVWGYEDNDATPRKSFVLAQELGGHVLGAFDSQGSLVAFAMAMAAFEPARRAAEMPEPYLHSHMLAVLPEYRNSGLGTRLKLAQREDALVRGIVRMTWTFDPLAAKNAYLNLHKLGAISRRYSPDFYGVSSSRLQGNLPSDRLHAEWWLRSERVEARVRTLLGEARAPTRDTQLSESLIAAQQTIPLPRETEEWKQSEQTPETLRDVQSANRQSFLDAFARGLAAIDFTQDADGHGQFVLAPWHPPRIPSNHDQ